MDESAYDVVFPAEGPLGIDIESSEDGLDAYVKSSSHPTIKAGHMLIAVNQEPLIGLTFDAILDKVKNAKHPRVLSFSTKARSEASEVGADLPLPQDFFKTLAPLTAKEEEEVKAHMNGKLSEALRMATCSEEELGLTFMKESNGVTIHSKFTPGSNVRLIRAKTKVNIAADIFMYAAMAPDNESFNRIFRMLDPMFRDGQVLHRIPKNWTRYDGKTEVAENVNLPFYSVKWACYALPFPLWWRDFVMCELTTWAPGGWGVSMAASIPSITAKVPSLEKSHNLVRGNIVSSGYLWRNIPGKDPKNIEEMQIEIVYILQVEPKGDLPEWAVNLTGAQQGMNTLRVTDYAEEQRKLIIRLSGENPETNRTEVTKAVIPKGETHSVNIEVKKKGELIVLDWILEDNDVSFTIVSPSGKKVAEASKQASTMATKPFHGRYKAEEVGNYVMTFDNSFSWFTPKTVYFHYLVVEG